MSNIPSLAGLFTPWGRFISGDIALKQTKDYDGNDLLPEDQEYYFAVAVNKAQPGMNELYAQIQQLCLTAYAQNPPIVAQIQLGLAATGFSWKIEDGDVVKYDLKTGQAKPLDANRAGCYIITFRSKYDFGACDEQNQDIARSEIKRGDYVDVMFKAQPNGRVDGNAGVKLYPGAIRRLQVGEPIVTGMSASTAFGQHNAGASVAPAPQPAMQPAPQPAPQPAMQPASQPAMQPVAPQPAMQPAPQPAMQPVAPVGNVPPLAMNPATMQTPQPAQPVTAGSGIPAAPQAASTASPSSVVPHTGILAGPQG